MSERRNRGRQAVAEPPIEDDAAFDRSKRVAVVVPTYNEAGNLPVLAERLFSLEMADAWMIVVDDGSPDGTAEVARNFDATDGWRTELIERGRKMGLGTAYVAGFTRALELGADYIVQMDADLSHEPEYIPGLLETLRGADVVVGSRYAPGGGVDEAWGVFRRMLSYTGNLGIRVITGLRVKDATAGFKVFDARVLASIDLTQLRCKGVCLSSGGRPRLPEHRVPSRGAAHRLSQPGQRQVEDVDCDYRRGALEAFASTLEGKV